MAGVSGSAFDGTTDASAFAAGAAAFAKRWEDETNARAAKTKTRAGGRDAFADRVTARWVDEPDPAVRRAVATGYLALEGALVECAADVFAEPGREADEDDERVFGASSPLEEDDGALSDDADTSRGGMTKLFFSYHAVYSPSYRVPVLLARARLAAPPRATLAHAQLDEALALADPGGLGSAESSLERPPLETAALFSPAGNRAFPRARSVFAPWDHPHARSSGGGDTGGCWLGAHPCETPGVMRLLFAGREEKERAFAFSRDASETRGSARAAEEYFAAWFAFASRAAPGLGSIARRYPSSCDT